MGARSGGRATGSDDVVRHLAFGTWLGVHECLAALDLVDRDDVGCPTSGESGACHESGLVATSGTGSVRALVWDDGAVRHLLIWCEAVDGDEATRLLDRSVLAVKGAELRESADPVVLPGDIVEVLEAYGRQEFERLARCGTHSSTDGASNPPPDVASWALADPRDLVDALVAVCLPGGGWAAFGAVQAVPIGVGSERAEAGWLDLLDAAIDHVRDRRLPWWLVPPHLADRFEACGGDPMEWLPGRPTPDPSEVVVTCLGRDEVRVVVAMETQFGPTRVRVQLDGPVFRAGFEDGTVDPDTGTITWTCVGSVEMESLFDLFVDVAWSTSGWIGAWFHPELRPFLPYPCEPPDQLSGSVQTG